MLVYKIDVTIRNRHQFHKCSGMPETTVKRYYRIDRTQIHFLKFILEGYDGVAVLRTVDPSEGLVALHIGPGCQEMVDIIIQDLRRGVRIEPVENGVCDDML